MTLEEWFDAGSLPELRRAVLAEAVAAGMPDDRAHDVVLAVHELAANAVRHGGGTGLVRMRAVLGKLHCHVIDAGLRGAAACTTAAAAVPVRQWLILPGHGLALVRDLADRLSIAMDRDGAEVTAVFTVPGGRPAPC